MTPTSIAIHGAAGRMGKRLMALASTDPQLKIVAALEYEQHPELGKDAGLACGIMELHVPLAAHLNVKADALIDFSIPEAAERILGICVQHKTPLVMATTGLNDRQKEQVSEAAMQFRTVCSTSMSLTVKLAMTLIATAAAALKVNA